MKTKTTKLIRLLALVIILATSCKETPPYTVQLEEMTIEGMPSLHSYTKSILGDKMIMLGGRVRGLHSNSYNFPRTSSNRVVYVISTNNWSNNTNDWKVDSMDFGRISGPGITGIDMSQFIANNAQFFTRDSVLYIIGGLLGAKDTISNPATLNYFTAVNLNDLVNTVLSGGTTPMPANSIRQVSDTNFAVTGGEVDILDKTVNLVFGWNFGSSEVYSHRITQFTYLDNKQTLSYTILPVCATCTDGQSGSTNDGYFRRRDGSMSAMIDPADGSEALLYYAGVFKNGKTNFTSPVWINKSGAVEQDSMMRSNVYTCQVIPVYSKSRKCSYATFLGGMKNAVYKGGPISKPTLLDSINAPFITPNSNNFTSVPFTNQFTTLSISNSNEKKTFNQYLLRDSFPLTSKPIIGPYGINIPANSVTYNGSEAELFWTLKSGIMPNGVIDYDAFSKANPEGAVIGYLHGGIQSTCENVLFVGDSSNNCFTLSSNRIFKVKLVPLK